MKLILEDEGHLYGNFLFHILSIYCKFPLFQFLSRGIDMHIPILTGVQNERISKKAKIMHILGIGAFKQLQIVSLDISLKIYFFVFAYVVFIYISKVLKSR